MTAFTGAHDRGRTTSAVVVAILLAVLLPVLAALHYRWSLEISEAISLAILLILAATMGFVLIASRRAQKLAQLQMNFLAAVSHELRTPLTVISSAGENIADGLITSDDQMRRYGAVIKRQSQQLISLVEQVMSCAAAQQRGRNYRIRRVEPSQIIAAARQSTADFIQAAGIYVKQEIQADLPAIDGDPIALSQCLQNLITNAVKYSGHSRWLAIRARLVELGNESEIQISVEDKGIGISAADIDRIFEPFYRAQSVSDSEIHGAGLGLSLARNIAEAMNGRISVSSQLGQGSTFVLHLPVPSTQHDLVEDPVHPELVAR